MDKNALVLAYIGDAIYEVMIREYLIDTYPLFITSILYHSCFI